MDHQGRTGYVYELWKQGKALCPIQTFRQILEVLFDVNILKPIFPARLPEASLIVIKEMVGIRQAVHVWKQIGVVEIWSAVDHDDWPAATDFTQVKLRVSDRNKPFSEMSESDEKEAFIGFFKGQTEAVQRPGLGMSGTLTRMRVPWPG